MSDSQVRGMLLEEAILFLLRASGYQTITEADPADATLRKGHSGLEVLGRGGVHQIDAIADHLVKLPFTFPQRLLVEAKCYGEKYPIGIPYVRNAIGVMKDVGEYWVSRDGLGGPSRYHYQYAIFSASAFTTDAQKYAFAHDVYLLPLAESTFIAPVIEAIRKVTGVKVSPTALRPAIRERIADPAHPSLPDLVKDGQFEQLDEVCNSVRDVSEAAIAMVAGRFPLFIVPAPGTRLAQLQDEYTIRITFDDSSWYLESNGNKLFSFDLPSELFERYAKQGELDRQQASMLKLEVFSSIQVIVRLQRNVKIVTFNLDPDWIQRVRDQLSQRRARQAA